MLETVSEHLCISALASWGLWRNPWESLRIYWIEPKGGRSHSKVPAEERRNLAGAARFSREILSAVQDGKLSLVVYK